ncbi:unnamed protein product [Nezara viridula]|uniref:Uncharacterized protein n=1 Tax=Nezara viridula TaxID=85310 RepID=A0A9P0E571_NEZVI|nr:unnamed protein product [Nezara viridula]
MLSRKTSPNAEKSTSVQRISVLEELEQLDEANGLSVNDQFDEAVLDFVERWQKLVEEYGYQEIMKVEFFKASHPYPEPAFPIKIMDEETYMTRHYSSVATWSRKQKRPTIFHVIEITDEKVIGGINISGPFNEYPLFQAFVDICINTRTLSVIRLIGCWLKKEGVMMLAECLPRTRVTHLYLDRNPLPDEDYSSILKNNTTLVHLSLAMCKIGFRGLRALSRVLGPYEGLQPTQRLKSLVLDDNNITSLAVQPFAEVII